VAAWAVNSLLQGMMAGSSAVIGGRPLAVLVPFMAGVCAGVVVYAMMIVALRAITLEDMKLFPKGEKIAKVLRIR